MSPLATGLAVTVLTTALVLWLVEHHAAALGLMDLPNDRSSHSRPMPRGGGIAIVLGSLLGLVLALLLAGGTVPRASVAILLGAALVALVSLIDDIRSLPPLVRLATHFAAAGICVAHIPLRHEVALPVVGPVDLGPALPVLAILWVVGVTNIYNFMDGIDGLAGGEGLVAGLGWGAAGLLTGDGFLAAAGFAIGASCAIFLARNWAPAHIFMGDAGSAFLGFAFAAFPLVAQARPLGARAWVLGVLILWPLLFDASLTLLARLRRRENVFRAHRSHLYQRLVSGGAPHALVSGTYILLSLVTTVVGLAWAARRVPGWGILCVAVLEAGLLLAAVRRVTTGSGRP